MDLSAEAINVVVPIEDVFMDGSFVVTVDEFPAHLYYLGRRYALAPGP